jgi:uncharacterized protein (TIGR03790 family)
MRKRVDLFFARVGARFCFLLALFGWTCLRAQEPGSVAVVVYNKRLSDSRKVAEHYAKRRNVPPGQIVALDLPVTETMTRREYDDQLRKPLLEFLRSSGLIEFKRVVTASTNQSTPQFEERVVAAKVRYLVLCQGTPLIIARDPGLSEPADARLTPVMAPRNEAAVDSELCLLPLSEAGYRLAGPIYNPLYATTNAELFTPTNSMFLVARLDGPGFGVANALVDKAMQAEEQGLWGRAYFDLRGLAEGEYKPGDDWIRTASEVCRALGFETVVDTRPETFSTSFPMSQIALYAGWYDGNASGPFTLRKVEFMPGAVAYHLHSYSAHSIRTATEHWVGPLLAKGATATMGSVDEPYLAGTPDVGVFFSRFVGAGFSFGEAAYAASASISWQTTVVGDPLYRPFAMKPQDRHKKLVREKSPLLDWSFLRFVDINLASGAPAAQAIPFLEQQTVTKKSAVLMEKLGDLYASLGKTSSAISAYQSALKLGPSPRQLLRLLLTLGAKLEAANRLVEARDAYHRIFNEFPDYTDRDSIRTKVTELNYKSGAAPSR